MAVRNVFDAAQPGLGLGQQLAAPEPMPPPWWRPGSLRGSLNPMGLGQSLGLPGQMAQMDLASFLNAIGAGSGGGVDRKILDYLNSDPTLMSILLRQPAPARPRPDAMGGPYGISPIERMRAPAPDVMTSPYFKDPAVNPDLMTSPYFKDPNPILKSPYFRG